MSRIDIEPYDDQRHPNPMRWFDDTQRERHARAPKLIPYSVCLVTVTGFTFIFHSVEQIRLCLDYYKRKIHPSSRLPVYTENLGGDHSETQRWFDRLPQYLLEKRTRQDVVDVLERAILRYSEIPGAVTGVEMKPYDETW
jgi:hypothetical protein